MTSSQEVPKPRRRWLRWLSLAAVIGLIVLLALVLVLPWIVEVPWVQRRLVAGASRVLAPSSVRFDHLRVSWTRPTEIDGLVLRDAQGDDIVVSPRAHLSWNLREILLNRPDPLTLTLDRASVDIERSAAGTVDLLETLKPILKDEPDRTLLVRVVDGKLRFRSEGLDEPFLADKANIDLDLNAFPQPIAWRMALERAGESGPPGSVQIKGSMSRKKGDGGLPEDLDLSIKGDRWPWVYSSPKVAARGAFGGTIEVQEKSGDLSLTSDAKLLDLHATGAALSGDELHLDTVGLACKLDRRDGTWTADRLDVTSAIGTIKASGSYPPAGDRGGHLEGNLDLAALARQVPRTLHLRDDLRVDKGTVSLRADVTGDPGGAGQTIHATANLSDLTATHGTQTLTFRDPATLVARLNRQQESLTLEQLDVQTPFLKATGKGDLDRGINVTATIDLGAATQRLRDWVELGPVELAGQGKVDAHYRRLVNRFEASASAEFTGLSASGLPAIETFRRNRVVAALKATGGAEPSGVPSSLHDFSLTAKGDGEDLKLGATLDQAAAVLSANATGRIELLVNGKKQNAEATLQARWSKAEVTLDQILLSLAPVVGPGGQFLPSEPMRWSGKGKYEIAKDELTIVADGEKPGASSTPLPLAPAQIRLGGLKSRDAAWLEVNLVGELSGLGLGANASSAGLAGQLSGLIQGRQSPDGWDVGARLQVHDLARLGEQGRRRCLPKTRPRAFVPSWPGSSSGSTSPSWPS